MSVFNWIRDGVRRSVLMGVSDAITQMGTPEQGEELHPQLAAVIGSAPVLANPSPASLPTFQGSAQPSRKRLGKSFEQIRQEGEAK
ncbi:MAG TPA: hypothetical protein VFE24_04645 [Pirellulales bacterium]|jgi:hypothetical protein|nr:hypothetical protein [Pirellulales bacterium]